MMTGAQDEAATFCTHEGPHRLVFESCTFRRLAAGAEQEVRVPPLLSMEACPPPPPPPDAGNWNREVDDDAIDCSWTVALSSLMAIQSEQRSGEPLVETKNLSWAMSRCVLWCFQPGRKATPAAGRQHEPPRRERAPNQGGLYANIMAGGDVASGLPARRAAPGDLWQGPPPSGPLSWLASDKSTRCFRPPREAPQRTRWPETEHRRPAAVGCRGPGWRTRRRARRLPSFRFHVRILTLN
nr:unnamed protein product [Digitaria exilis]